VFLPNSKNLIIKFGVDISELQFKSGKLLTSVPVSSNSFWGRFFETGLNHRHLKNRSLKVKINVEKVPKV
jgi:hypothetical protein